MQFEIFRKNYGCHMLLASSYRQKVFPGGISLRNRLYLILVATQ